MVRAGRGEPSQRQLRVGELIRHTLAEIFMRGEVDDAEIDGHNITVPEVRMSADLKLATVFVMPLGGKGGEQVVESLARRRKPLRAALARHIDLKFVPDLRFRLDTSFDRGERIEQLLRSPQVARDLRREEDGK